MEGAIGKQEERKEINAIMGAGKGARYRRVDKKKFDKNYDLIFKRTKCERRKTK